MVKSGRRAIFGSASIWLVLATAPLTAAPAPPGPSDLALLDALTWGASPTSFSALRAQGREAWLSAQLHPAATMALPPGAQSQIEDAQPKGPLIERVAALDA